MSVTIAIFIIAAWAGHLVYALSSVNPVFDNPWMYVHALIQAYFYTGLFITGHDAMHRLVSKNPKVNKLIGTLATNLFAALSYKRLVKNHFLHHKYPGTEKDPDYSAKSQNFFIWYFTFMFRYATVLQIIVMAIAFNILKIWFHFLRHCSFSFSGLSCRTVNHTKITWNHTKREHKIKIIFGL